jgi:hypothetical protein
MLFLHRGMEGDFVGAEVDAEVANLGVLAHS